MALMLTVVYFFWFPMRQACYLLIMVDEDGAIGYGGVKGAADDVISNVFLPSVAFSVRYSVFLRSCSSRVADGVAGVFYD